MKKMEGIAMSTDQIDTKYYNMKQFIKAARQYSSTKTEESSNAMNRYLQLLSVTIDYSTFDPQIGIVPEFFICLHDLLSNLETRSSLIWCCINVLSVVCRNAAARRALIHTYQFVPPLSRLVDDHLAYDKKIKILTLLQELTCGIKISWQIPHLPHLMTTLTKWIENSDEDIIVLSLGVLVNLCYKNLPAIYVLSRCTNIKKFMRTCLSNTTPRIEMYICKLLIILEHIHGGIQDCVLVKMIEVTFKTIADAINLNDSISLRHIVDFFMDIYNQNDHRNKLIKFQNYYREVETLLQIIENNMNYASPSGDKELNPECIGTIFEFLLVIIDMKIKEFVSLHSKIITIALKWIQTDVVCNSAIGILRTIALYTDREQQVILEPIAKAIPILIHTIDNNLENVENVKRLSAIMHLLQVLVQDESFRKKILEHLNENVLRKLFNVLLENKANNVSEESVNMYIYELSLIDRLAAFDEKWLQYECNLLQQRPIYAILAQGLFDGNENVKLLILEMTHSKLFSMQQLSMALTEFQVVARIKEPTTRNDQDASHNLFYPILSITQSEKLEELITKLSDACTQNNFSNIPISDVVELFEYKIASLSHAELIAMNSAEAASRRCTHLQHRMAQFIAELTRLNQVICHKQQQFDNVCTEKEEYVQKYNEYFNKVEFERGLNKVVRGKLEVKQGKLEEQERINAEQKNSIVKLENNIQIMENQLKKKEELLNRSNIKNEELQEQIEELQKTISTIGSELAAKGNELKTITRELEIKKNIVEEITKLASGRH